jgi:hypothetical protein
VYYLDEDSQVRDHMLTLPVQYGLHFGLDYARLINEILTLFGIMADKLGYFVVDNESKNGTTIQGLADLHGFNAQ